MAKPDIFDNTQGDYVDWQMNSFTMTLNMYLGDEMQSALIRGMKSISFEQKEFERGYFEAIKHIANIIDGGNNDGE